MTDRDFNIKPREDNLSILMNYSLNKVVELGFKQAWNILCKESQPCIVQYVKEKSLSKKQEQLLRDYCSISSSIMLYDAELALLHLAFNNSNSNIERRIILKEYNALTYTLYRYWFEKDKKGKSHFDRYCEKLLELQSKEDVVLSNIRKREKIIRKSFSSTNASFRRNMAYHYTMQPHVFVEPHKIASILLSLDVNSEFFQRNQLLNVCDDLLKIYSHVDIVQELLKTKLTPLKSVNIASIQFFNQNQTIRIINAIDSNINTQWSVLMENHKFYDSVLKVPPTYMDIIERRRYERLFRFVMYINLLYLDLSTFFKNYLIAQTDYERWFFIYRLNVVGFEGVDKIIQLIEDFISIKDDIFDKGIAMRLKEGSAILSLLKFNKELRHAFVDFQGMSKGEKYIQNMRTIIPAKQVCVLICLLLPELNNFLWASIACVQAISQKLKEQQTKIYEGIKEKIQSLHPLLLQYAKSEQEASNIISMFDKLLSTLEI